IVYENLQKIGKERLIMKTIARNDGMFLLGVVISAPLGSIIANLFSINIIVLLMIIPYFLSLIITISIFKTKKAEISKKRTTQIIKSGFKELWKNEVLKTLVFEKVIIEIIIVFLVYTYQYYILLEYSIPIVYFGFIDAGVSLSQFTFLNLIPQISTSSGDKKKVLLINTIIPGIGYILIAIINFAPAIIFLFLIVIGLGLSRYIIFTNGINRQIKQHNRTTILSTINVLTSILKATLYPLVGFLVMININFLYIFLGALILIVALKSRVKKEYL
ncbi:MAG: MFS transporter, partial [Candidatus Hermodarchaeota archaeon]